MPIRRVDWQLDPPSVSGVPFWGDENGMSEALGERHLRHVLQSYLKYYNETRTHLSLDKDAPILRAVEAVGRILSRPVLGGLYHHYVRI